MTLTPLILRGLHFGQPLLVFGRQFSSFQQTR